MQGGIIPDEIAAMKSSVRTLRDEVLKARLAIDDIYDLIKQVDELIASPIIRPRSRPPD